MDRMTWLTWRNSGLGSSDAPIIMGVSPWRTALQLWEEKTSPVTDSDDNNNYIKRKGTEAEPRIRAYYELHANTSYPPQLFAMEKFPFMRASLDGFDGKTIIEIKLLGLEDFENAKNGIIPPKYYPQIQHQLLVSGAQNAALIGYYDDGENPNSKNIVVSHIRTDKDYQAKLLEECIKFWDLVQKKKPPQPSDKDFKTLKGMVPVATKFKRLSRKVAELEKELAAAREDLITAAETTGHPRCIVSGVKIVQVSRVGNVNYKAIPELANVDLEKYRGKGSLYYKVGE